MLLIQRSGTHHIILDRALLTCRGQDIIVRVAMQWQENVRGTAATCRNAMAKRLERNICKLQVSNLEASCRLSHSDKT